MLTVYQIDSDFALLGGARQAPSKGDKQVLVSPPGFNNGFIPVWRTDLCHIQDTPTFGDPDTGSWEIVEDHRGSKLYTQDGEYRFGDDYNGQSYTGLGEVPSWLSTSAPQSEPQPEPIPQQVTRAQGKAALITAGLWQQVLDYVDGITDPTEKALAEVALNDTTHWQRYSPFLNNAAIAIGLTSEQLDDLFLNGSKIHL